VCMMFGVGFVLAGCNNSPAVHPIVGTWTSFDADDNHTSWFVFEIKADGSLVTKYVLDYFDDIEGVQVDDVITFEGTWTVNGNKITSLYVPDPFNMSITDMEFELSNNNNTLVFKDENSMVLTRVVS